MSAACLLLAMRSSKTAQMLPQPPSFPSAFTTPTLDVFTLPGGPPPPSKHPPHTSLSSVATEPGRDLWLSSALFQCSGWSPFRLRKPGHMPFSPFGLFPLLSGHGQSSFLTLASMSCSAGAALHEVWPLLGDHLCFLFSGVRPSPSPTVPVLSFRLVAVQYM